MIRIFAALLIGFSWIIAPAFADDVILTLDGQKLTAKWSVPAEQIRSVALILQGSGNVGADGDVSSPFVGTGLNGSPAKLSEQIADSLAAKGIASLRYSKRGVDDPSQLPNQKFPYLQQDAEAALAALQFRFPGKPVSVVGLSEGALVATLLADDHPLDGLFLLSPPFRPLDQLISYQFVGWPLELVKSRLAPRDGDHIETQTSVLQDPSFQFPLADVAKMLGLDFSLKALDANHDQVISIKDELVPTYQKMYQVAQGLLQSPGLKGWYDSCHHLPEISSVMAGAKTKNIFIYVGMEDSQVKWTWIVEDAHYFKIAPKLSLYPGLGHCFAPMSGSIGSIKASGPMDSSVLTDLANDVATIQ